MKKLFLISLVCLFAIGAALAVPPKVELFWKAAPQGKPCIEKAKKTMEKTGFRLIAGTYEAWDVVGISGDFTGVISCTQQFDVAVFVVSGPDYKKAKDLALALTNNF